MHHSTRNDVGKLTRWYITNQHKFWGGTLRDHNDTLRRKVERLEQLNRSEQPRDRAAVDDAAA